MTELISDVYVFPVNHSRLLANASFKIANAFVVKVKVVKTEKGMMVSMPSEKYQKDGETIYSDIAFPCTKEARSEMTEKVIEAYKAKIEESNNTNQESEKKGDKIPF